MRAPTGRAEMDDLSKRAKEVDALVRTLAKQLVGKPAQVQGAVLADLLAMWLAGHVMRGDPKATEAMREEALDMHLKAVRALIDINYKMSVEPQIKAKTQ